MLTYRASSRIVRTVSQQDIHSGHGDVCSLSDRSLCVHRPQMPSADQHTPPQRTHNLLLDLPGDVWSLVNLHLRSKDPLMLEQVSKSVCQQQRAQPAGLTGRLCLAHMQQNKALFEHCSALKTLSRQIMAKSQQSRKVMSRPEYLAWRRAVGKTVNLQQQHTRRCHRLIKRYSLSKEHMRAVVLEFHEIDSQMQDLMVEARLELDKLRPLIARA